MTQQVENEYAETSRAQDAALLQLSMPFRQLMLCVPESARQQPLKKLIHNSLLFVGGQVKHQQAASYLMQWLSMSHISDPIAAGAQLCHVV